MNGIKKITTSISGSRNKPIGVDVFYKDDAKPKGIVVFAHGFKGFKDWGHFNEMAELFAQQDLVFVKFNFSHNGTTLQNPTAFDDLEAFGQNNYILELNDLQMVIDWILALDEVKENIAQNNLALLGHSRGGGICILKAAEDKRVTKLVTWASVSDFVNRNKKKTIGTWERDGVVYALNNRTKQKMPLYRQFYDSTMENKDRLNILKAADSLTIPFLIVHGTEDEAVDMNDAKQLHKSCAQSQLLEVEGGGHTFGIKHPFNGALTPHAQLVIEKTIDFIKKS